MVNLYVAVPITQTISVGTSIVPVAISRDGELTVAVVVGSSISANNSVQLPSGCSVGDVVEVYCAQETANWNVYVMPPSGEVLNQDTSAAFADNRFRKIQATVWGCITSGSR